MDGSASNQPKRVPSSDGSAVTRASQRWNGQRCRITSVIPLLRSSNEAGASSDSHPHGPGWTPSSQSTVEVLVCQPCGMLSRLASRLKTTGLAAVFHQLQLPLPLNAITGSGGSRAVGSQWKHSSQALQRRARRSKARGPICPRSQTTASDLLLVENSGESSVAGSRSHFKLRFQLSSLGPCLWEQGLFSSSRPSLPG